MFKFYRFSVVVSLLISCSVWAKVNYDFNISQQSSTLTFQIYIENNETSGQQFELFADAKNVVAKNAIVESSTYGTKISVDAGQKGFIRYDLAINPTKFTFFTEEQAWFPKIVDRKIGLSFLIQSNLEENFKLVHSAVGKLQDSIALAMGPFKVYSSADGILKIFLQSEDAVLAETLITNLEKYKQHYEKTIAPYPHADFSVVECPDEIGWAFPKMTWIGSKLLRFPFILKTSLPHELLHSWWGNGVYVDYDKGNWCEGLTVFGADYGLLNEQDKKLYRLKTLTTYLDYVKSTAEISLSDFVTRGEDPALQAVGYGKSMMVFVMLEQMVGSSVLKEALKNFYQNYQFKKASWRQLLAEIEDLSGQDLSKFEEYWIKSKGNLSHLFLKATSKQGSNLVNLDFDSNEADKIIFQPINLKFISSAIQKNNIVVQLKSSEELKKTKIAEFTEPQLEYVVDPDFYLFRDLSETEKIKSFSGLFTASQITLLMENDSWYQAFTNHFSKTAQIKRGDIKDLQFSIKQNLIIGLPEAWNDERIRVQLESRGINFDGKIINFDKLKISTDEIGFFLNVQIEKTTATIVYLSQALPIERWLQRWMHYSQLTYVILATEGAVLQGQWLEEDKRKLF